MIVIDLMIVKTMSIRFANNVRLIHLIKGAIKATKPNYRLDPANTTILKSLISQDPVRALPPHTPLYPYLFLQTSTHSLRSVHHIS